MLLFAAAAFSDLSATPLISEHGNVEITLSNDCFGEELALSRDDHRSYGVGISTLLESGWSLSSDYYGYTFREFNQRTEELMVNAGYAWELKAEAGKFIFLPKLGGRFIGNLCGQELQNFIHRVFGIKQVDFIYDDEFSVQPVSADLLISLDFIWRNEITTDSTFKIVPEVHSAIEYSFPSGLEFDAALLLNLSGQSGDFFSLYSGYSFFSADFPGSTVDNALLYEKGWYAGFGFSTGILGYTAKINPFTGFANGYITLSFNTTDTDADYKYIKPDFIFGYLLDFLFFEKQVRMRFPMILSKGLSVLPYIDLTYGDAFRDFYNTERQIRLSQISAGAELSYTPGFFNSPVEVFAGLGTGLRLEKYWDLGDSIEYNPGLLIQPEAGIRTLPIPVFPESGLFNQNCLYGLSLSYGFQWLPLGNLYVEYQHKVSLGLEIWCDF